METVSNSIQKNLNYLNRTLNHIVFLTPGFAPNEQDTTTIPAMQVYLKALKNGLPETQITIIAFQYPYKKEVYNWNGCQVIALNGGNKIFQRIFIWQKAFQILKALHRKNPISILHSFWLGECAFVGHWFSKRNQLKHLVTLMGQDALKRNGYTRILPIKKMQLVALSHFQEQIFYKNYNTQTTLIPWGINLEDFSHSTEKNIDIIGVGSLTSLKNYELFIDAIYELNQKKPIKAIIIGDGIQKELLQKKIVTLGLEKVIVLKGLLSHNETLSLIAKSKILLHTSNYESFGLVFAEALQSKTRIVSKKIGGAFDSQNWAIAENKTEMIAACEKFLLTTFAENEENPFTIDKTVQAYLKIYHE